jgi:acetyltransferase-like isoleucine patch superfamily enzyme
LITGHHVTVRENVKTGKNFQIGTSGELQGDTTIGDYVRLHSGVLVAKNAKIGNYIWLLPKVVITDDPHPPSNLSHGVTLEDFVVIATRSVLFPGIVVRKGAVVGAGSVVTSDVPADTLVFGVPATPRGATSAIKLRMGPTAAPIRGSRISNEDILQRLSESGARPSDQKIDKTDPRNAPAIAVCALVSTRLARSMKCSFKFYQETGHWRIQLA